ncbi:MAG TPA: ribonuclease H-like domain-containing protein [Candidatus Eisenbacteria bacterium]|nr:ribonuclease H-like domain-containing protein [Candidatus Eisenbacteria bacterium]
MTVLTKAMRERIGDLFREEAGAGVVRDGAAPARNGYGTTRAARAAAPRHFVSTGIEEILPGGLVETEHGPVFVHERLYTDLGERPAPLLRKLAALSAPAPERGSRAARRLRRARDLPEAVALADPPERGLFRRFGHQRILFLDIETCGLSAAPVFLVGLCHVGERNLVLRQLFARDYAEERALLAELARIARGFDFLVTFNGKSFDVPFLRDRAIQHRMPPPLDLPHLDQLWMARRRWKEMLPNCRLTTLEWHVLRRRRAGDVGGAEIPGLYHDYVKRGEAHRLLPVFHHNLLDVVAMVELTPPLFDPEATVY